jgi:hypothetical protein
VFDRGVREPAIHGSKPVCTGEFESALENAVDDGEAREPIGTGLKNGYRDRRGRWDWHGIGRQATGRRMQRRRRRSGGGGIDLQASAREGPSDCDHCRGFVRSIVSLPNWLVRHRKRPYD